MIDQPAFATMRGMDILIFIRDSLLDEASRKKGFLEQSEKYGGGVPTDPELRQRVCALEAAADGYTYIIGLGQDELALCASDKKRRFPDWITRLANQARHALVEEQPDTEDQPAG